MNKASYPSKRVKQISVEVLPCGCTLARYRDMKPEQGERELKVREYIDRKDYIRCKDDAHQQNRTLDSRL